MVAGRLPFSGALSEVKLALRYRPAVPPRWHNRELPDELDSLIMKMLAKLPADRPANMVELSRALERIGMRRASSRRASTAEVEPEDGSSPVRRGLRIEVRRPTIRPPRSIPQPLERKLCRRGHPRCPRSTRNR